MRYLTTDETKSFYDAWGEKQDNAGPYESLAFDELLKFGWWQTAKTVFELGPGTGNFALTLLQDYLPNNAEYSAWELSDTMLGICRQRLKVFKQRINLQSSTGGLPQTVDSNYDRIIANFVLDIFTPQQIDAFFDFAYQNLLSGGLLCLSNLSFGQSLSAKLLISLWRIGYWFNPKKFGGCRPLKSRTFLNRGWQEIHFAVVEPKWGIPSEVLILKKL